MAFIWWPYCIIMLVPGIVWYSWGFWTTERKDFNSTADFTSNWWTQGTFYVGAGWGTSSVSGWKWVFSIASNDTGVSLNKTFGSSLAAFDIAVEYDTVTTGNAWWIGRAQPAILIWGWDFPTLNSGNWSTAGVSMWLNQITAWGYTGLPIFSGEGTDQTWWAAGGTWWNYVYRIKFNWSLYTFTQETTGGTVLVTKTYASTKKPNQIILGMRAGYTSEAQCTACEFMELKY